MDEACCLVLLWLVFPFVGMYVAASKHRSKLEGFVFGLILGLIGIFIVLLLPTRDVPRSRPPPAPPSSRTPPSTCEACGRFAGRTFRIDSGQWVCATCLQEFSG